MNIIKNYHITHKDPFCTKKVRKRQKIYEEGNLVAIYDSKAMVEGHSLIITKHHSLGLLDLKEQDGALLFKIIKKVLPPILNLYNCGVPAYDLKIRSGDYSGRTVNHFHVHMIPRRIVSGPDGKFMYERIYENNLKNPDRPFLDDISEEVKSLRRKINEEEVIHNIKPILKAKFDMDNVNIYKNTFYVSEHFMAIYHPNPVIEGHSILVPRRDFSDLLDISESESIDLVRTYAKIMKLLLDNYGKGSRSYITSMVVGGYDSAPVDRLHINLIPRSKLDCYSGRNDEIYYDLYENAVRIPIMKESQISDEAKSLRRMLS